MQSQNKNNSLIASLLLNVLIVFGCVHYWHAISSIPHSVVTLVTRHFHASPTDDDNPMLLHPPVTPGEDAALSTWATSKLNTPGMVPLLEHMGVNYVRVYETYHGILEVVLGNRTDDEFAYISKHPMGDMLEINDLQASHDVLAAAAPGLGVCTPLVPVPPGVSLEDWLESVASCPQDRGTKYVSRASFAHQILPWDRDTKAWVAYQVLISGHHAYVYAETDHARLQRSEMWFKQSAFDHIDNALVQMALMWRARQSSHLGEYLTNCSFVRTCSDYEGDQTNSTAPSGMYDNTLGRAGLAANGVGPLSFVQIKTLTNPYLKGGPPYVNMGGDQFERALQFGYEFCCEGEGGGPWNYMTPGMAKNVAYEFYAYTALHPDFLKNNPSWFDDHQAWTARLREAGIRIPARHVTPNDVDEWVKEGHILYAYTLGKILPVRP